MAFREWIRPQAPSELQGPEVSSGPSPLLEITSGRARTEPNTRFVQPTAQASNAHTQPDGRLFMCAGMALIGGRYRFVRELGEGVSAQVILAEDTFHPDRQHVVIKVLHSQYRQAGIEESRVLSFLKLHSPVHSGGVVQLKGCCAYEGHVCLVMERLHGNLLDLLCESARLDPALHLTLLERVAVQLLSALSFIHSRGIVHADIKPENVLLTRPVTEVLANPACLELRLVDFGSAFSTLQPTPPVASMQTLQYRAPEVVLHVQPVGPAMDVWSAGCILAELARRWPLFNTSEASELLPLMCASLGHAPSFPATSSAVTPQLADLQRTYGTACPDVPPLYESLQSLHGHLAQLVVFGLLRFHPQHRLTADEALLHPFCYKGGFLPAHTTPPLAPQLMQRGLRDPGALLSIQAPVSAARTRMQLQTRAAEHVERTRQRALQVDREGKVTVRQPTPTRSALDPATLLATAPTPLRKPTAGLRLTAVTAATPDARNAFTARQQSAAAVKTELIVQRGNEATTTQAPPSARQNESASSGRTPLQATPAPAPAPALVPPQRTNTDTKHTAHTRTAVTAGPEESVGARASLIQTEKTPIKPVMKASAAVPAVHPPPLSTAAPARFPREITPSSSSDGEGSDVVVEQERKGAQQKQQGNKVETPAAKKRTAQEDVVTAVTAVKRLRASESAQGPGSEGGTAAGGGGGKKAQAQVQSTRGGGRERKEAKRPWWQAT